MGYSSQAGQLILRSQAVQGVYQADTGTAGVGMKLRSGTFGPNRELMIPDPEIGGGRDVVDANLGPSSWSGDFEFYARLDSLTTLLYAALGTKSSAVVTGITTNTLTPLDSGTLPFLSVEENVGGSLETFQYTDVVVNTLHLECDASGYMMGTVGLIAAKQIAGATKTAVPVYDNLPMIVGTNVAIQYNSLSLPAKNFSLDINNNIEDDDFRLGSFYLGDLTAKRREITASFGIRESSSALWRQATYGTTAATQVGGLTTKLPLTINAQTYEAIVGGTPANTPNSLGITIPKFALSPYSIDPSGDDVIESDVDGQALRPDNTVPIMTVLTKSAKATIS